MADVRQSEDGGFEVRLAGSKKWKAVTAEEAAAYEMSRGERMAHSLGRGAESLIRGGASLLDEYVGNPRGELAPESAEDNAARLAELNQQSEAMGRVDPRAGLTAYAPEAVGALVPGGLPAAIATEAGIGAARNPEAPVYGALVGAAGGAAGGLALPVGRVAGRALSKGTQKGLDWPTRLWSELASTPI